MNNPVIKIEKELAEILGFPEEPSVKFLKDYTIKTKPIETFKTDGKFNIDLTKCTYSIVKSPTMLENIYTNIYKLFTINEVVKTGDYTLSINDSEMDFSFNPYKVNSKTAYKNTFEDQMMDYTVMLHYKYTDYTAYSESYKIMNSVDSKDFKPIILDKFKEKINYNLNKLYTIFKSQRKVIWNNLIELCGFDTSNLNINIQDFTVNKSPSLKKFKKYKTLDNLDYIFDKMPNLEEIYDEINNSKYAHVIRIYIKLLNDISKTEKIVCFLQLIQDIDLYLFGKKTINLLIDLGLPF
jgi:hypothetical protein